MALLSPGTAPSLTTRTLKYVLGHSCFSKVAVTHWVLCCCDWCPPTPVQIPAELEKCVSI